MDKFGYKIYLIILGGKKMEIIEIRYNFDEVIDRSGINCFKYDFKS